MDKKMYLNQVGVIKLSSGDVVKITRQTMDGQTGVTDDHIEATNNNIESFDNLIFSIANDHAGKVIGWAEGPGKNLLYDEILHIVKNEIKDPKKALTYILYLLTVKQLHDF